MAKRSGKRVETLLHEEASRKNIPSAEHEPVMAEDDRSPVEVAYERRNRDLDPQLVWRGKDEQNWSDLVVQAPPLFIQEKGVAPKLIIINELWDDAWARHLWDRTPVFDTFARAETTRDRIGGFGRASAASEWLARHAAPIACRSV